MLKLNFSFLLLLSFILFSTNVKSENWELSKHRGINYYSVSNLKNDNNVFLLTIDSDRKKPHLTNIKKIYNNINLNDLNNQNIININITPELNEHNELVFTDINVYNNIMSSLRSIDNNKIKIVNLSWTFPLDSNFQDDMWNYPNTYYVISSGNSNEKLDKEENSNEELDKKKGNVLCNVRPNVICVGGTDYNNEKSNFSAHGVNVNILAPSGSSNQYENYIILNNIIEKEKPLLTPESFLIFERDKYSNKLKLKNHLTNFYIDFYETLNEPEIKALVEKKYNDLVFNSTTEELTIEEKFNAIFNILESPKSQPYKYKLDSNGSTGTSFAAPLVAGSLYYAFSENMSKDDPSKILSNQQVIDTLKYTGVYIPSFSGTQLCGDSFETGNRRVCESYFASNPRKVDLEAAINAIRNQERVEIKSVNDGNVLKEKQWRVIDSNIEEYSTPSLTKKVGIENKIEILENESISAKYLQIFKEGSVIKGSNNNNLYSIDVVDKLINFGEIKGCFSEDCLSNNNYNSFIINAPEFINYGIYELNSGGVINQTGNGTIIVKDNCSSVNANEGLIIVNYNQNQCNLQSNTIEVTPDKQNETYHSDIINKFNINGNHSNGNSLMTLNKYAADNLFSYNVNNFITDTLVLNENMNISNIFSVKNLYNNGYITIETEIKNSKDNNNNSLLLGRFENTQSFLYNGSNPLSIKVSDLFYNESELKGLINFESTVVFNNKGELKLNNLLLSGTVSNTGSISVSDSFTIKNIPSIKLSSIIGNKLSVNKLVIDGSNLIIDTNFEIDELDIINGGSVEVTDSVVLNIKKLKNQNDLNNYLNKGLKGSGFININDFICSNAAYNFGNLSVSFTNFSFGSRNNCDITANNVMFNNFIGVGSKILNLGSPTVSTHLYIPQVKNEDGEFIGYNYPNISFTLNNTSNLYNQNKIETRINTLNLYNGKIYNDNSLSGNSLSLYNKNIDYYQGNYPEFSSISFLSDEITFNKDIKIKNLFTSSLNKIWNINADITLDNFVNTNTNLTVKGSNILNLENYNCKTNVPLNHLMGKVNIKNLILSSNSNCIINATDVVIEHNSLLPNDLYGQLTNNSGNITLDKGIFNSINFRLVLGLGNLNINTESKIGSINMLKGYINLKDNTINHQVSSVLTTQGSFYKVLTPKEDFSYKNFIFNVDNISFNNPNLLFENEIKLNKVQFSPTTILNSNYDIEINSLLSNLNKKLGDGDVIISNSCNFSINNNTNIILNKISGGSNNNCILTAPNTYIDSFSNVLKANIIGNLFINNLEINNFSSTLTLSNGNFYLNDKSNLNLSSLSMGEGNKIEIGTGANLTASTINFIGSEIINNGTMKVTTLSTNKIGMISGANEPIIDTYNVSSYANVPVLKEGVTVKNLVANTSMPIMMNYDLTVDNLKSPVSFNGNKKLTLIGNCSYFYDYQKVNNLEGEIIIEGLIGNSGYPCEFSAKNITLNSVGVSNSYINKINGNFIVNNKNGNVLIVNSLNGNLINNGKMTANKVNGIIDNNNMLNLGANYIANGNISNNGIINISGYLNMQNFNLNPIGQIITTNQTCSYYQNGIGYKSVYERIPC